MVAVPSELTTLDFFEIKESIRSYLRTRDEFTDYDFEGSGASYLLDLLAYNTYYTSFNANMAMNEAFLESATVRDNVIKIAKHLNYIPRSTKAAKACLRISVQTKLLPGTQQYPNLVTIRKGDSFVSRNDNGSFVFCILEDSQISVDQNSGIATFNNFKIYQGNLLTYSYTITLNRRQNFTIPSEELDTELLNVFVKRNKQSNNPVRYEKNSNVISLNEFSKIYYIEEVEDLHYKIIFGDGVIGRKLENNEYVIIEYVRTEGVEANGCRRFNFTGRIKDSNDRSILPADITIATLAPAQFGADRESDLSIKQTAPKMFTMQNRAVTEDDYAALVKQIYPEARLVTVYGGEKLFPPIYGKIFISIGTNSQNVLSKSLRTRIRNELLKYTVASIEPVIVDLKTFYISPNVYVSYNSNSTTRTSNELSTDVLKVICLLYTSDAADE